MFLLREFLQICRVLKNILVREFDRRLLRQTRPRLPQMVKADFAQPKAATARNG
jgi:hypothetical protein